MKRILSFIFTVLLLATTICASDTSDSTSSKASATSSSSQGETSMNDTTRIKITVNGKTLYATFDDNATSRAIIAQMPLTLSMLDLYGDEMCYRFAIALPTDNVQSYIHEKGEIFYWPPRHSFVIRYVATSEELDIQHIGQVESGVEIFGGIGNVDVSFEVAE